jgi:hypothetical protein
MKSVIIKESDLKERFSKIYKEEQIKILEEKWDKLSKNDKLFVVEFLKQIYPNKAKLISESKWYNTVGDILGFLDPTGVVDIVNGISYWRQGDKMYALLSWISALPIIGDVIGKSVIGLFKMGGSSAKAFKMAALAGDATKMAKIAKRGGPLKGLLSKSVEWGGKILSPLKSLIGKVPFVGPGFIRVVEDFVKLFTKAGAKMEQGAKIATNIVGKAKTAGRALTTAEKSILKKALESATTFRGFRDFKGAAGLSGGMGRLWGNRSTRGLMRRTKWYLGLLGFLGLKNFVNPDDLENNVVGLDNKIEEYNKTEEAKNNLSQDLGEKIPAPQPPTESNVAPPLETKQTGDKKDLMSGILSTVFPELKGVF